MRRASTSWRRGAYKVAVQGGSDVLDDYKALADLWLDGNDVTESGGLVTSWNNQGLDDHFHSHTATGTQRPTYNATDANFNSEPSLTFNGTSNFVADTSFNSTGLTEAELFLVGKIDNDPPAASAQSGISLFGSGTTSHFPFTNSSIFESFGTTLRKSVGNPTDSLASPFIYNIISQSGEFTANINGSQIFTTATNTVGWNVGFTRIGVSSGGSIFYDGEMVTWIVFDFILSGEQRSELYTALESKYL